MTGLRLLRGVRDLRRSPLRAGIALVLLAASLTLAGAMVALDNRTTERLDDIRASVGTSIRVSPAVKLDMQSGKQGNIPDQVRRRIRDVIGVADVLELAGSYYFGADLKSATVLDLPELPRPGTTQTGDPRVGPRPGDGRLEDPPGAGQHPITPPGAPLSGGRSAPVHGDDKPPAPILVGGVSVDTPRTSYWGGGQLAIVAGRRFVDNDANASVAVMGQQLADANGLGVGSTFTLQGERVQIVGLYRTGTDSENSFVVPLATYQRLYRERGVASIAVFAASRSEVSPLMKRLRSELGSGYDLTDESEEFARTFALLESVRANSRFALTAALVTAAFVVGLSVLLTVRQRRLEIGALRAIGASRGQVLAQMVGQSLGLGLLAAAMSAVVMAVAGSSVAEWLDVNETGLMRDKNGGVGTWLGDPVATSGIRHQIGPGLTPLTGLVLATVAIALVLLASVATTVAIARVRPAETLRVEG